MTDNSPDRLADVDETKATPLQREVLQRVAKGRGRVPTPYRVWLHCPEIADGMETIGTYLNTESSLSDAEIEIVILSVAAFWHSPYVLENHTRHSRKAGLEESAIAAMRERRKPEFTVERQRLVGDFVWAALEKKPLADTDFATMEREFGRRGIAELLLLIGYYSSVALAMKFHDVSPNAG
jgi:4-carboxymuconolactone decarboxylase